MGRFREKPSDADGCTVQKICQFDKSCKDPCQQEQCVTAFGDEIFGSRGEGEDGQRGIERKAAEHSGHKSKYSTNYRTFCDQEAPCRHCCIAVCMGGVEGKDHKAFASARIGKGGVEDGFSDMGNGKVKAGDINAFCRTCGNCQQHKTGQNNGQLGKSADDGRVESGGI